jgi:hypothetical protein
VRGHELVGQPDVLQPAGVELAQLEQVSGDGGLQGREVGADVLHREVDGHERGLDLLRGRPGRQRGRAVAEPFDSHHLSAVALVQLG